MQFDSSRQLGQTVGAKLRAARQARKYTQHQLAQPDFSVSYVSAIERGQIQPSLRALEILAHRLELSAASLLPSPEEMIGSSLARGGMALAGEERELLLLEAQIHIHQGNPQQAIDLLRPLLDRGGEKHQESVVYYILSRAYLESGLLQESEQLLARAAQQAREAADPFYPCILSLQMAVYVAINNTEQAAQLEHVSQAFLEQQKEAEATSNVFFRAHLYASLGQYYNHQGHADKALEMFTLALSALRSRTSCRDLQTVYAGLAQTYREKEVYSLATLYNQKWLLTDLRLRLAELKRGIQHTLGHALLKSKSGEAYAYLSGLLQEDAEQQNPLARASANLHLAFWFVEQSEFSKAEACMHEAVALANPFGETIVGADLLFLQAELAYAQRDYPVGDQHFEAGLLMLEHLGEEENLIEHFASYACLLEGRGLIHKAIIYWKRAFENRQKSWVTSL